MNRAQTIIVFALFGIFSALTFQNCGGFLGFGQRLQGTSTGNPSVHLSFAPYGTAAQGTTLQKNVIMTAVDPLQSVSVILCISGIEFNTVVDPQQDQGQDINNIQISVNEVSLSPLGTDLDFISLPAQLYHQVVIKLDGSSCSSGNSVTISNAQGTFSTSLPIQMHFNGSDQVNIDSQEIVLTIQDIVQSLSTATSSDQIQGKIESVIENLN